MVAKGLSFTSKLYFAEIICDKAQLEICPTLEIIISLLQHNIGYGDTNIRQSKLSFDFQHICILEAKKHILALIIEIMHTYYIYLNSVI